MLLYTFAVLTAIDSQLLASCLVNHYQQLNDKGTGVGTVRTGVASKYLLQFVTILPSVF